MGKVLGSWPRPAHREEFRSGEDAANPGGEEQGDPQSHPLRLALEKGRGG